MKNLNRRDFLQKSAGLAVMAPVAANLWGTGNSWSRANDRVNIGVVGIRNQGFGHIRGYSSLENVEVTALCDVDENLFPERVKWLEDNGKPKPKLYTDIRDLLDDKDIDAIVVATTNHWHALAGFWAVQAGKHANLEKPCTHNVFEGRQLIKAAKKYNRLINHDAERRCYTGFQSAVEFMRKGGLGEVYMAKGICYKWRNTIGKKPDGPVPDGVHYDLWLGPAPKRSFNPNRFHYNWHWHWDYGNGDIGNQGAHQMDIAQWGLGVGHPTLISSMGGHFMFDDDQETPNTQIAVFEFPGPGGGGDKKKILQFEVRHWVSNFEGGLRREGSPHAIGNLFYGSEGYMTIDLMGNWKTFMGRDREPGPGGEGTGSMSRNFIRAIRANDASILEGGIEKGHYSSSLIHLANISYRLGRSIRFDPEREQCIDDKQANAMLTRDYREPFVIPEKF
jgi:predicted dehydrogenase